MCKKLVYVSIKCDCLRCACAPIFDTQDRANLYPHFGWSVPGPNHFFTYINAEEPCDSASFDEERHWVSCDNVPTISEDIVLWCGKEGAEVGYRFCDGCERTCMAQSADEYLQELDELEDMELQRLEQATKKSGSASKTN